MTYKVSDFRWGDDPLGDPSPEILWSADLSDLFGGAAFDISAYETVLDDAFETWEQHASVTFTEAEAPGAAQVTVTTAAHANNTVGLARLFVEPGDGLREITSATIEFDDDQDWAPNGEDGGVDFSAVALHEIGHVLGLEHVLDTSEIMNPVIEADVLGDGDVEGVRQVYGSDPDDTTPAPRDPEPANDTTLDPPSGDSSQSVFEKIFGWFFDFLDGLFGGGGETRAAQIEDDGPDMTGDVRLSEIVPIVEAGQTEIVFALQLEDDHHDDPDHHDHDHFF